MKMNMNSNRKILVINYYWPPSGGAAVQRWLALCNLLAEMGWEVSVLTVAEQYATYQVYDTSLTATIHEHVKVYTTRTIEPFGLFKLFFGKKSMPKPAFADGSKPGLANKIGRFVRGNIFVPDPRKYWKYFAVSKAKQIIAADGIPLVVTAGPPHSTHFIGEQLKKALPIRWICDFHDLWTDIIFYDMLYKTSLTKKLERQVEKRILENCDHLFTVGEGYKRKLLSKSDKLTPDKISIVPIGYDEKLFLPGDSTVIQPVFTITYVGTIAAYYQPEVFFAAVKQLITKYPAAPVKLLFVGVVPPDLFNTIEAQGLANIWEYKAYVPHQEAVAFMKQATVLLLVNPVTRDEEIVIPGKLYEYMACKRPIINITSLKSETAAIIERCGAGRTFDRTMLAPLVDYLESLLLQWQAKGTVVPDFNEAAIASYSQRAIAGRLSDYLSQ
jgi:glycosyltransferase involved in cell wall biosynthesis